jgi:FixJ family two-component response regulator
MTPPPSAFVVAVVYDDESALRSLKDLLESAHYAVRPFTSGAALLESGCLPHLGCLISDIGMRGMDGIAALKRIHATRPGLPTILITDHPDRLKRLPQLGGIYPGLFTKPCNPEELAAAVSDVLRNSAS